MGITAINHHFIIGLILIAVFFIQPILGWVHHVKFKKLQRRTGWSHAHLWTGRFGITLGIVNGPVEGILILVFVYALTGYMGGASFWQQSMFSTLSIPHIPSIPSWIYDLSFTQWYMAQGTIVLVFNTKKWKKFSSAPKVNPKKDSPVRPNFKIRVTFPIEDC